MNLDGLTIAVLAAELSRSVVGSRIQKIYHPRPGVVTLELWAGGEQLLLIETEENPRIHLTQQRLANPPSAVGVLHAAAQTLTQWGRRWGEPARP
jgi:predicted ribosome quality control (RQC) complex YloA/Tae2 family protein